jgi:flagellar assembly protein FliH
MDTLRAQLAELQRERAAEFAHARAEGLAAAKAEAAALLERELARVGREIETRTERALQAMNDAHRLALSRVEQSVGEVSFAALCQIIGRTAASKVFSIALVEQVCLSLRATSVATARLHPRDIDTLQGLIQSMELRLPAAGLRVKPDESLQLGGCVLETECGEYDGSLETQLRRLHALLTERR